MEKRFNIDGLPGITLQGKQGSTGERGSMTHIGFFGAHLCDAEGVACPGLIDDDGDGAVTYTLSDNQGNTSSNKSTGISSGSFVAIMTQGIVPIIGDSVICTDEDYTYLYRITQVITINSLSYSSPEADNADGEDDATTDISDENNERDGENYSQFIKALQYPYIGGVTNENGLSLIDYLNGFTEEDRPIYGCILEYVDAWSFSASGKVNIDFRVEIDTVSVNDINAWEGEYEKEMISCTKNGHKFTLNVDDDDIIEQIGEELMDTHNDPNYRFGRYVNIINPQTDEYVEVGSEAYNSLNYDIGNNPEILRSERYVTISVFDVLTKKAIPNAHITIYYGMDDDIHNGRLPDMIKQEAAAPFMVDIGYQFDGNVYRFAQMAKVEAEGYAPGYYTFDNKTVWKNTISAYLWTNEVLNSNDVINIDAYNSISSLYNKEYFYIKDYYSYFNSSIPKAVKKPAKICQFSVISSMSEEDKEKIKIEAVFKKQGLEAGVFEDDMCTMKTDNWIKKEDDKSRYPAYNYLNGRPYNLTYDKNFDNEHADQFSIIIKDFKQGNKEGIYTPKIFLPVQVVQDCTVSLYVYVKTSPSSSNKIYLGSSDINFTSSIDEIEPEDM